MDLSKGFLIGIFWAISCILQGQEFRRLLPTNNTLKTIPFDSSRQVMSANQSAEPLTLADISTPLSGFRKNADNLHDANYFVAPSARPYITGFGLFRNQQLVVNSLGYGISKNLSVAGGFEFSSLFRDNPIWFASVKLSFELIEDLYLAGGYAMIASTERTEVAQAFAALTTGNQERNITIGVTLGQFQEVANTRATFNLSGFYQLSYIIGLMSENHFVPAPLNNSFYIGFQGIRVVSGDSAIDLGASITTADIDIGTPVLPFLGYSLLF